MSIYFVEDVKKEFWNRYNQAKSPVELATLLDWIEKIAIEFLYDRPPILEMVAMIWLRNKDVVNTKAQTALGILAIAKRLESLTENDLLKLRETLIPKERLFLEI